MVSLIRSRSATREGQLAGHFELLVNCAPPPVFPVNFRRISHNQSKDLLVLKTPNYSATLVARHHVIPHCQNVPS